MGDVYFTSNPSEFGRLEGLYVSERTPPGFIRGVNLSVVGFAGKCVRGPLTPQTINSTARFLEVYGGRGYFAGDTLKGEVWKALLNKPFGPIVVRRVAAAAAALATATLSNAVPTAIVRVDASSVGAWANGAAGGVKVSVEAASDGDANHFNLRAKWTGTGKEVVYKNINLNTATDDNTLTVLGDDIGNLITLTKLANGRPINIADVSLAGGSDGAVANGDYQSALNDLAVEPGVAIVLIPEAGPTPATINGYLVTLAPTVADRLFLTWSQVHGQTQATEVANVAAQITTRSDRIWWCYNSPYTNDSELGTEVQTAPHVWLASILSQIDVDVHPGAFETTKYLAGIKRLTNTALSRADLIALREAGITTLERFPGYFQFRSVVTTSLTAGLTEGTRRRMADFLLLSASDRLRFYVKMKNTDEVRAQMGGELVAFSKSLKDQGRVIEDFSVDQESVNTAAQRARGEEHMLWNVNLIDHILGLVLEANIGTGVVIERSAA